jgi:hypothetical protein
VVSEAAPFVGGGAATAHRESAVHAGPPVEPLAPHILRRVLQAAHNLDPSGVQAQLDRGAGVLGLPRCVDEILMPANRQLSRLTALGQPTTVEHLLAIEALRTWLAHRALFAPSPLPTGPMVLACGPRDRDTVPLESLALLLRYRHLPCRVLGARVTPFTLTIAAQAADATGVVIVATDVRRLPQTVVSLRAAHALDIPVFVTGPAFAPESNRLDLPGRYLGPRLEQGCSIVVDTVLTNAGFTRQPPSS